MRRFLRRLLLRNWESQSVEKLLVFELFINSLTYYQSLVIFWNFETARTTSQLHLQLKETTFKNELKSPFLIYFYFHKILSTMLQDTKQKSSSKCFFQMKNVWTIFVVKVKYWLRKSANGRIGDLSYNKI